MSIIALLQATSIEVQIFIVIFITLLVAYSVNKSLDLMIKKSFKTKNIWDDSFIYAIKRPVRIVILVLGIGYALEILDKDLNLPLLSAIDSMKEILVIFAILIFVLRLIRKVERNYISLHKADKEKINTINAVTKLLRISVVLSMVLILMQSLGINISGVLAFGGVSGIAVGFAAKDLLSNFFGALMIYLDKPFKIGDWIRSPDQQIEGVVAGIGWRQTKIITFEKRPIYVPNSIFSTITVENPSRMSHRRIYEKIGVRYEDVKEVDKIADEIKDYLLNAEQVDTDQALIVNFNKFADSALEIMVYCYIKETDWIKFHQIKHEVLLDIVSIISNRGADIAYPTITISGSGVPNKSKL